MVICEDSVVRGTQLKNYTIKKLWENGAKEIHIRPACPPLMFPCRFASSTRSVSELATYRAIQELGGGKGVMQEAYLDHESREYGRMVEWIRRELDVTTLRYLSIEDMIAAIGLPERELALLLGGTLAGCAAPSQAGLGLRNGRLVLSTALGEERPDH